MGCDAHQRSVLSHLRHDQHLPDQPGSPAGAAAPQQAPVGPRPHASSIAGPQQAAAFGHPDVAAVSPDGRGIRVSLLQRQIGKYSSG